MTSTDEPKFGFDHALEEVNTRHQPIVGRELAVRTVDPDVTRPELSTATSAYDPADGLTYEPDVTWPYAFTVTSEY